MITNDIGRIPKYTIETKACPSLGLAVACGDRRIDSRPVKIAPSAGVNGEVARSQNERAIDSLSGVRRAQCAGIARMPGMQRHFARGAAAGGDTVVGSRDPAVSLAAANADRADAVRYFRSR